VQQVKQDLKAVADELWARIEHIPEAWIIRIHRFKGLQKKLTWIKVANERFPQNPNILYNFGCYLALNKDFEAAKRFVLSACKIQIRYLFIAYEDNDLDEDFWWNWYSTVDWREHLKSEKLSE